MNSMLPKGSPAFEKMKEQARVLWSIGIEGRKEVKRHGRVSTENRHKCRFCFCCAALEVWRNYNHAPV